MGAAAAGRSFTGASFDSTASKLTNVTRIVARVLVKNIYLGAHSPTVLNK
ncbi:hypothetical protein BN903_144 [Halorubrum sp. AJ67]|nr:hypothetical protein BN903_144 [Halorubrum sp. AJ67]